MKRKRWIVAGIVILACGGYLLGVVNQKMEAEVMTVQAHKVTDTFTEDGIVKQGDAIKVMGKVSGNVKEVKVKVNQYVEKGDVIAVIDPKDYNYQVKQHESNIAGYKAQIQEILHTEEQDKANLSYSAGQLQKQLESLEASKKVADIKQVVESSPEEYINLLSLNLESCQNSYDLSLKNYNQLKELYEIGAVSEHEVEVANNTCISSKAALTKAQTQLEASQNQLKKLKEMGISSERVNSEFYAAQDQNLEANMESVKVQIASLKNQIAHDYSSDAVARMNALISLEETNMNQLKDAVKDCTIKATSAGYITELPVLNLSQIQEGCQIATIKPNDTATISCNVLTTCEPYLKVGDRVELTQKLKSKELTFSGTIEEIYDFAKASTSALGLKEYRVEVIVRPDDTAVKLKDGYEIEVTFTTYKEDHVLSVPNSATFEIGGQDYVYKVEENQTILTPVEVLYETNTESVIAEGIHEGDIIIYNANAEGMTENIRIKPINK